MPLHVDGVLHPSPDSTQLRSGHAAPIHDRQGGRRDRTEGGIATDRHLSIRLRTIEPAQIPPDQMTGPRWVGAIRAFEKRQPVTFAVAIYRNGRGAVADGSSSYRSSAQKWIKAAEKESKRHERTCAHNSK